MPDRYTMKMRDGRVLLCYPGKQDRHLTRYRHSKGFRDAEVSADVAETLIEIEAMACETVARFSKKERP